jgi:hypothetical protein
MDYKIWILLVVLMLLILYVIKEIYFIRFDLLNYINSTKNNTEETNLLLRKNFQNDLNVFANKIKLLNDENLQQFRKITLINAQPIVKNSNYFKEMTCTDSDNETELKYLSDSKMMMSKNSKTSKKSAGDNLETTSISNFSETSVLDDNHKKLNNNNNNENNEINEVDTDADVDINEIDKETLDSENSEEISDDESHDNKNTLHNLIAVEETDSYDDSELLDIETDSDSEEIHNNTENEPKQTCEINENIQVDNIAEEISVDKSILENPNKSTKEKLLESVLDNITLGTKKSKQDKKTSINSDLNNILIGRELNKDVNCENFKTIDEYNLETLKTLAKKFNIPLSTKVQGKWKSLNKTEIYSEISKFLNKNI